MTSKVTGEGDDDVKKNHCNFRLLTATFEHRDENKTCSACREWLNERLKECESEKEWEWDSEREWEWESVRVSFEHRDENKSCSACQEWLNERLNECESEKEWESDREWEWEWGRERESESVIWFPAFVWHSDIFLYTYGTKAAGREKITSWARGPLFLPPFCTITYPA